MKQAILIKRKVVDFGKSLFSPPFLHSFLPLGLYFSWLLSLLIDLIFHLSSCQFKIRQLLPQSRDAMSYYASRNHSSNSPTQKTIISSSSAALHPVSDAKIQPSFTYQPYHKLHFLNNSLFCFKHFTFGIIN